MSELRILVVATQIKIPGVGGGQTHVSELLAHLREHGEVLALTRRGSSGPGVLDAGRYKGNGLPPKGLRHAVSALNYAGSLQAVRDFAPNVIYERGSSFGLGTFLSRTLKVPMLTMLLDEHMSPLSLRHAQFIITTNPGLVPPAFRNKAVKVSWGANTQRFRPGLDGSVTRKKFGFSDTDYVAGYSGTFRSWHGLELLLDVADTLPDPSLKFLMIGPLDRGRWFTKLVAERGLQDRFVFTDGVPYDVMPEVLSAVDVCVAPFNPTRHQGAAGDGEYSLDPLKVFEYLALEKPVVTINSKNILQLFDDGVHLRAVPPLSSTAFAEALGELRDDPERSRAMGKAGCERVQERHTWSAHAKHLATLFGRMREG